MRVHPGWLLFLAGCAETDFSDGADKDGAPCADGEHRCAVGEAGNEGNFEICRDKVWISAGKCDGACDPKTNACATHSCPGGAQSCTKAGLIERCSDAIGGWEDPAACGDGLTCDPTMGDSCIATICPPNATRCSDAFTATRCNPYGTADEIWEECNAELGEECFSGACQTLCDIADEQRSFVGCDFYAVDLDNDNLGAPEDSLNFSVVVSNPHEDHTANVVMERRNVDGSWSPISGGETTVGPLTSQRFQMGDTHLETTGVLERGAYRITSSVPVFTNQFNAAFEASGPSFSSGASLVFPKGAVAGSNRYFVLTLPDQTTSAGGDGHGQSEFTVVAMEDDTAVGFRLGGTSVAEAGGPVEHLGPGESAFVTLDEGDVLLVATPIDNGTVDDMTGTFVEADKPIAVFGSNEDARSPTNSGYDMVEEQLPPVDAWDTVHAASPLVDSGYCYGQATAWRILAAEDKTELTFDAAGVAGLPSTGTTFLDSGEMIELITTTTSSTEPPSFVVTSSAPVLMVGFFTCRGSPSMWTVTPVSQWLPEYVFLVGGFFTEQATVMREVGADVLLDGVAIVGPWSPIGTSDAYDAAVIDLYPFVEAGAHRVNADTMSIKENPKTVVQIWGDAGGCDYAYVAGRQFAITNPPPK